MKFKKIPFTILGKKQKALIMDGNLLFRAVTRLMLEECGYEAFLTKDGIGAIDLFKRAKNSKQPFDVVILDLINHGGIGGEKTMSNLLAIDPDVRAVASSEEIYHPAIIDYRKYGFCGVLPKPFTMEDLRRVLSDAGKKYHSKTEYVL